MLTFEQIQEGRARLHRAEAGAPDAAEDLTAWFVEHGTWLLDLAALAARDALARASFRSAEHYSPPGDPNEPAGFVLNATGPNGESVATYFNAKGEPVHNPHDPHQQLVDAAAQLADEERAKARERYAALRPACVAEFEGRPLMADDQLSATPRAFAPKHVSAWLQAHGLQATIMIDPRNPRELLVDPLRVIG